MSKRQRVDRLTGGTRDVNPQTLGGKLTESAADTFTELEITVPVMRVGMPNNRAQVIEVLWVEFDSKAGLLNAAGETISAQVTTSTKSDVVQLDDADLLANHSWQLNLLTSGASIMQQPFHLDLSDGAGHGLIVATPSLFFGIKGTSTGVATQQSFRIGYRFKNVSLSEFIGLAIQQS